MIGERIRSRRLALGLTQQDLAQRLGKDQSSVSRIERGQRTLSIDALQDIAAVLQFDPAEWLRRGERLTPGGLSQ